MTANFFSKNQVVNVLSSFRREWEETGADLVEARGSVGMMLADMSQALDLEPGDLKKVLGAKAYKKLEREGVISKNGSWEPEKF